MKFLLHINYDRKLYSVVVHVELLTSSIERYKIVSGKREVTLQSNRPDLRKRGLKHKRPYWRTVAGTFHNSHLREEIIKSLMKKVDNP